MPRMSGAEWAGEHGSEKMTDYDIVCVHTIVGHDPAHASHFSTGNEGLITQSRDTKYQSAANFEGNHRVIAIENEDTPPGWSNDLDFTYPQKIAIAQIIVWCHKTHGIPIVPCPDSRPKSRGIAYHRQGIDGNFGSFKYGGRVPGGERWSKAYGKMCPGDRRIQTLLEEIIPMAKRMARPPRPPVVKPYGGDDMFLITFPAPSTTAILFAGGKLVRIEDQMAKAALLDDNVPVLQNCSPAQWKTFQLAFGEVIDA